MMQYTNSYLSPIGNITLAGDGEKLTGLWFAGQKYFGSTLTLNHEEKELPIFRETKAWLDLYFNGKMPDFTPPLSLNGSPFRLAVWELLLQIPYGTVMTYGELARKVAGKSGLKSMSGQAVGGAVGHNPISIIVPCHRVVGSSGSLTGYAGGIEKKISLLTLEKVNMTGLFLPKKGTAL